MNLPFTGERYVPELRGQIYYEHFHRYAMVLELARGGDVLDIACGEGYGTAALSLVAKSAVGVDNDGQTIQHAAARYTAMNIDFRLGDCTEIPAADSAFDLVVSFETIEHLAEQERMLKEVRRVLKPNGRLVISSPNKLVYSDAGSVQNPYHVRELYFHEFRDLLRSFFPAVKVFGQRIFAASAVHPLRGAANETRWLGPSTTGESAMSALPEPQYFIAICGRSETDGVPDLCSVYLDPRDELLADIRSGGLAGELSPAPESSNATPALVAQLSERDREIAEYSSQARRLEEHAGGLETLLEAGRHRSAELASRVEELSVSVARASELQTKLEAETHRSAELTSRVEELSVSVARASELQTKLEAEALRSAELTSRVEELSVSVARASELQTKLEAEAHRSADLLSRLEELSGSQERAREELHAADIERQRLQRALAGVRLECDSMREANAESQRRHDDELLALEAALFAERGKLDFELTVARQETLRLQAQLDSSTHALVERSVELEEARERLTEGENARRACEQTMAQLKLETYNWQDANERAAAAEAHLADIMSSRSWRMTMPARRFMTAMRAGRKPG